MKHVVMFSGGVGSWAAAKRVAAEHGTDDLILLFTDTKIEDEDLHRFLHEAAADVGGELVIIEDGRNPWEVFKDVRYQANSRVDPCSRVLKREISRQWAEDNMDPEDTTIYLGIDWTESHRLKNVRRGWGEKHKSWRKGWRSWRVEAPMCDAPYRDKRDMLADLDRAGIRRPKLYEMGFSHNNCGGFCVKAGQAQFALLLNVMPERYAWHEQQQRELAETIDSRPFLRMTIDGAMEYLTLESFRETIESQPEQLDMYDWGGCGCFLE